MSENNEFTFENEQYRKTYWHTCRTSWRRPSSACTRR